MRTRLSMGMTLALFLAAGLMTPQALSAVTETAGGGGAAAVGDDRTYTLYSAIPRVAGIKTLIDFNDYDNIMKDVKGYVNVRYSIEGGPGDDAAARVGYEPGMPVIGWTLDPPHSDGGVNADRHLMRQLTVMGNLFADVDPARQRDAYASAIAPSTTGTAATTAAAAETAAAGPLPKDRFGGVVYTISKEDMMLDAWVVELNSSANTIPNRRHSYAKTVTSHNGDREYLGVRVRFPTHDHNAHARIAPAYPIPAYDSRGFPINYGFFDPQGVNPFSGDAAPTYQAVSEARSQIEDLVGNADVASKVSYGGMLHNTGDVREIVARVAGRNYRNGLAVRLRNQNMQTTEYFLGYMDFLGWRTLRWVNPNYLPAELMEPFRLPLYPSEIPFTAFDSFIVYRNGEEIGGDFVAYFDYIKMDYDLAVPASQLEIGFQDFIDIDDDSWWYVIRDRNQERTRQMMQRFSEEIDLRRQNLGRLTRHSEGFAPTEQTGFTALNEHNAAAGN